MAQDQAQQAQDDAMSDLDRIREIILEPGFSEMFERILEMEKTLSKNDISAVPKCKTDIQKLRQDVDQIQADIGEIKIFMQQFSKKITTAFKAFSG
jgi:hypothetical protein